MENGDKQTAHHGVRREQQSLKAQWDAIFSVNISIRMWGSLGVLKGKKKVIKKRKKDRQRGGASEAGNEPRAKAGGWQWCHGACVPSPEAEVLARWSVSLAECGAAFHKGGGRF